MKNKSIYIFLIISCLLIFLAGCGKNDNTNSNETNSISVNRVSTEVSIRKYYK